MATKYDFKITYLGGAKRKMRIDDSTGVVQITSDIIEGTIPCENFAHLDELIKAVGTVYIMMKNSSPIKFVAEEVEE
jgi:hypothetical protein